MAETRTLNTAPARMILGLLVFTMVFSLVGGEIEKGQGKNVTLSPFQIILGGTIATSLLTLLAHAGEAGEQIAVGLATVTFLSVGLGLNSKPIWDKLNDQFGSKPTTPIGASTPTAPTTSPTATTAALAPAALGAVA